MGVFGPELDSALTLGLAVKLAWRKVPESMSMLEPKSETRPCPQTGLQLLARADYRSQYRYPIGMPRSRLMKSSARPEHRLVDAQRLPCCV